MADLPPATIRFRNRLIISAFGVCALVFLVSPFVIRWWGTRDLCPTEITARGRSSGTDWEVARSDCGKDVGTVWQVRIIPTKGYSNLAFEARGGPEPVAYEQKGYEGTITLKPDAAGKSETVKISLGPQARPDKVVRYKDGQRIE